jgi:hypothetical protein
VSTHCFLLWPHPSHANLHFSSGSGQQKPTAPAAQQEAAPAASTEVDTTTTTGAKDVTVEQEIAPAVEHETVKREHETREQAVIDRERQ